MRSTKKPQFGVHLAADYGPKRSNSNRFAGSCLTIFLGVGELHTTRKLMPKKFQAWIAVSDGPQRSDAAKDLARRLRKGAGADLTASGATRISGSVNFKSKYAPEFPVVTLSQVNAGHVTTVAELDAAGIIAPKEEPRQPQPAAHRVSSGRPTRKTWPSYKFCLDNAPLAHGENKPDTSRADFTWCRTAIEWGWSIEATASRLLDLSAKAKENGERYATLTATRAAESVERQPYRLKPTPLGQPSRTRKVTPQ